MGNKHYDLIYYCDSYPAIGNGHLKRSFDIINSLFKKDNTLKFAIMGKYSKSAKRFIRLFKKNPIDVLSSGIKDTHSKITILDTMHSAGDVDTIDEKISNYLKIISEKLYVINTGFNTRVPLSVDAIINYVPIATYTGNVTFEKYFGFDYTPVSEEFSRNYNNENYSIDILCIIGGSKKQNGPEILSNILYDHFNKEMNIVFILSPHFDSKEKSKLKKQFDFINYEQNISSISKLMARAKTIICTYGNTTYESMTMHKPTFIVSYLKFQNKFAEYLENTGNAINVGFFDNIKKSKLSLINNEKKLKSLKKKNKINFKTSGIENISQVIIKELNNV